MVVRELKKDPQFVANKNYGLTHLMGQALIVQLYHKISTSPTATPDELKDLPTLPAQAIMDNEFYYGEHPIIGHLPVSPEEYDPLISLGRGLSNETCQTVYLQYGLIYKETTLDKFSKEFPDIHLDLPHRLYHHCLVATPTAHEISQYRRPPSPQSFGQLPSGKGATTFRRCR